MLLYTMLILVISLLLVFVLIAELFLISYASVGANNEELIDVCPSIFVKSLVVVDTESIDNDVKVDCEGMYAMFFNDCITTVTTRGVELVIGTDNTGLLTLIGVLLTFAVE